MLLAVRLIRFLATLDPLNNRVAVPNEKEWYVHDDGRVTLPGTCSHLTFSPDNKMLAVISDPSREDDTAQPDYLL
jgi:hypothetical protein